MQENVKVFTPEVLVEIFGEIKVKGDFSYKLRIDHISNRELRDLAKVNEDYGMSFSIRRSGKGLIIYNSRPSLTKRMTIRGVFETRLSDEERFAAFNNTPKYKWDSDVESDHQALDVAFDFKTSPEGYDYWNKVFERLK